MVKVKRPVTIKLVVTEALRADLQKEYEGYIEKYQLELEQLLFQGKKLLQDAMKRGPEAHKLVQERLNKEERVRRDKIKQYTELLTQLKHLQIGSEIEHSRLETEVEVRVGDHWDKLMGKYEIVVKDGIVVDIRREGDET